jgi:hypothetical protein
MSCPDDQQNLFSVGMPDLEELAAGHSIIGTWPRSPSGWRLPASDGQGPCLPSPHLPRIVEHESTYDCVITVRSLNRILLILLFADIYTNMSAFSVVKDK